ncbi:MAG: hypothetical protein ACXV7D_09365, partial [Thermoanaerobaculia bacterium]
MPISLDGGCRVVNLKEGKPQSRDGMRVWQHFQGRLSLRVIEIGDAATFDNDVLDEVLYDLDQNV